jgi:hypothetical protein
MLQENPSVILKRKNIQVVIDYCIENRIEWHAAPKNMPEEWEIEFTVSDIMKAINLGMFLKEHRLDLAGFGSLSINKPAIAKTKGKKTEKEEKGTVPNVEIETPINSENTTPSNLDALF